MFQFTSTTVINKNEDYTTGLPLYSAQAVDATHPVASFNVKRVNNFKKPNILAVYKATATDPVLGQVTFDLSTITQAAGVFRISLYIRLSGSQNSYYANDMVFKGKPLNIEFEKKAGETSDQLAQKVVNIAKKYMTAVYEKPIVRITSTGPDVTIHATDGYQLFTKADLEYYNPDGGYNFCCNTSGGYEPVVSAKEASDPEFDTKNILVQGKQGFGTYDWIMQNLRLPTAANTRWDRIIQDETPILGAKYNQYTLVYCVARGIMGGDAVGETVKSQTTHVFYVNQAIAADFEAAIKTVIGDFTTGSVDSEVADDAMTLAQANAKAIADLQKVVADKADKATVDTKANQDDVVLKAALGDGLAVENNKTTVKLDGDSLAKSAAGLKVK